MEDNYVDPGEDAFLADGREPDTNAWLPEGNPEPMFSPEPYVGPTATAPASKPPVAPADTRELLASGAVWTPGRDDRGMAQVSFNAGKSSKGFEVGEKISYSQTAEGLTAYRDPNGTAVVASYDAKTGDTTLTTDRKQTERGMLPFKAQKDGWDQFAIVGGFLAPIVGAGFTVYMQQQQIKAARKQADEDFERRLSLIKTEGAYAQRGGGGGGSGTVTGRRMLR